MAGDGWTWRPIDDLYDLFQIERCCCVPFCQIDLFETAVNLQAQNVCPLQVDPFAKVNASRHLRGQRRTATSAGVIEVELRGSIIAKRVGGYQHVVLSGPPSMNVKTCRRR